MARPFQVFLDAQALQNPWSAERGIGRYLSELILALDRIAGDLRLTLLLNPDLPPPDNFVRLANGGRLTYSDRVTPGSNADVLHVPSPFEPSSIDRVWPVALRGLPLVVTVFDLIPFVLSDLYMTNPTEARWFKTRLELVRRAETVMAISGATAEDVIERVSVPPKRVAVVNLAPAARFVPASDPEIAFRAAHAALPGLRRGYVFYPGGMDRRKNIERLIEAYAGLPRELRSSHQLVVACHLTPEGRTYASRLSAEAGVSADVFFPGYVSDGTLVLLYQSAEVVVFPSLFEGFGLPVAEALACGVPVIASRTSSIPELIEDEQALFDPYDPRSIRSKLLQALRDAAFRERLRSARLADRYSWTEAAKQTARVYETAGLWRPRNRPRTRRRLAVVAGLPPDPGTARETFGLLAGLGRRCDVDVFGETLTPSLPDRVHPHRLASIDVVERARGGYDAVLSILGDGPLDLGALATAKTRSGHVFLRGGLTRLYALSARERPDLETRGFDRAVRAMYRYRFAGLLGNPKQITLAAAEAAGLLLTTEVVGNAAGVLVQSEHAKRLVELDAGAPQPSPVAVVPVGFPEPAPPPNGCDPLVAARLAGGQDQARVLFDTLTRVAAEAPELELLVVVADRRRRLRPSVSKLADAYGIPRVVVAQESDRREWSSAVRKAAAALYLPETTELAISPFLIESLSAGVRTAALDRGAVAELPDEVVVKLDSGADPALAAATLLELIRGERPHLARAATDYAGAHSHDELAERVYELIFD